jgi:hypothetical protein
MEAVTITVDQKWVDELIKRMDKYHMFKDRNQKIWEMVKTTAEDEVAMKEKKVTQTMVEGWCRENGVKLVEARNLEHYGDHHNTSWMDCPALWINPYDKYTTLQGYDKEDGVCPSHAQCWECSKCIDPMEGGIWGKEGESTCSACRSKYKIEGLLPGRGPEIDVNRPSLPHVKVTKKGFVSEKISNGVLEKHSHDQLKRTAAENGMTSSGTKEELISRLYEYLKLHGRFKRDLKVLRTSKSEDLPILKVVEAKAKPAPKAPAVKAKAASKAKAPVKGAKAPVKVKVAPKAVKVVNPSKKTVVSSDEDTSPATPKKKAAVKKDPNAPKRPASGYMFYGQKRRPELKKSDPKLGFGDLTKQIAGEWNALSDQEKKPFLKLALKDKARYEKEKEAYE